jgi:hypothetical protein
MSYDSSQEPRSGGNYWEWDKCPTCGARLFKAVPGETTEEEIVEFARHSQLPGADCIAEERWIHPGIYCPNGCTQILLNYVKDDLWDRMEEKFEQTHTCFVTILSDETAPGSVDRYSIYIDGNIAGTRRQDTRPSNGEFVKLEPGRHRIVVREADHKKADRIESNTIWFEAVEGSPLQFRFRQVAGGLELTLATDPGVAPGDSAHSG